MQTEDGYVSENAAYEAKMEQRMGEVRGGSVSAGRPGRGTLDEPLSSPALVSAIDFLASQVTTLENTLYGIANRVGAPMTAEDNAKASRDTYCQRLGAIGERLVSLNQLVDGIASEV